MAQRSTSVIDRTLAQLLTKLPALELLRIVPMAEAERLSSMSADTLERNYPDKIVHTSPRRKGMRVVHALILNEREEGS
jgi:hypothetical protein